MAAKIIQSASVRAMLDLDEAAAARVGPGAVWGRSASATRPRCPLSAAFRSASRARWGKATAVGQAPSAGRGRAAPAAQCAARSAGPSRAEPGRRRRQNSAAEWNSLRRHLRLRCVLALDNSFASNRPSSVSLKDYYHASNNNPLCNICINICQIQSNSTYSSLI